MNGPPDVVWHPSQVGTADRSRIAGGPGITLWLTGLSGSGKSTLAARLERRLIAKGRLAYRLDGDNVRHGLNGDLGFSAEDRAENVRRIGEVARLMADAGMVVIVAAISPYTKDRMGARRMHEVASIPFVEVFVDAPLAVSEARDPKGLYRRARSGELAGFTGVDGPYEAPAQPDVHLRTDQLDVEEAVAALEAAVDRWSGRS